MDPQISQLAEDLTREFEPAITRETVDRIVSDSFDSLADARIKSYVPVLARRLARDRLQDLVRGWRPPA